MSEKNQLFQLLSLDCDIKKTLVKSLFYKHFKLSELKESNRVLVYFHAINISNIGGFN